jgi:cellulose synthase/poly-beta-1,6-N-acetylglucosamine synthase-like glycosyltransferase
MSAQNPVETSEIVGHTKANNTLTPVDVEANQAEHQRPSSLPKKVAILIPSYNEEASVAEVVDQFRAQVPAVKIYVFDNNSTNETCE